MANSAQLGACCCLGLQISGFLQAGASQWLTHIVHYWPWHQARAKMGLSAPGLWFPPYMTSLFGRGFSWHVGWVQEQNAKASVSEFQNTLPPHSVVQASPKASPDSTGGPWIAYPWNKELCGHTGPQELLEAPSGDFRPDRALLRNGNLCWILRDEKLYQRELGEEDPGRG